MKILQKSAVKDVQNFQRVFDYAGSPGAGFAFPCDAAGNVDAAAYANFAACLAGVFNGKPVIDRGVKDWSYSYREPAVGACNGCGAEVVLDGFTNSCHCGRDYNSAGQELAPRRFWGEETGETASDILLGGDALDCDW